MSEEFEASQYFIPRWDCPACGDVNEDAGQDDLTGEQVCDFCKAKVTVTS